MLFGQGVTSGFLGFSALVNSLGNYADCRIAETEVIAHFFEPVLMNASRLVDALVACRHVDYVREDNLKSRTPYQTLTPRDIDIPPSRTK